MDKTPFIERLDSIRDLPTISEVAAQLNSLIDSPETTIEQISDTIQKDPAMVGKVLRLVNSSFFGIGTEVASVSRAVVILGLNAVRNALMSISIIDSMKNIGGDNVDLKAFWKHAITCAVIGRVLASRSRIGKPEEAFTVGIVHDIGKLVLAKYFPEKFSEIMVKVSDGKSFFEAENGIIPIHHNEIGAYLAQRWGLPQVISDGILFSHNTDDFNPHPTASLVSCADSLANAGCLTEPDDCLVELPGGEFKEQLQAEIECRGEWLPDVVIETEAACSMLLGGGENGE